MKKASRLRPRRRRILLLVSLCSLAALYVLLEPRWLKMRRFTITDPDVPPAFDGVRIVFASDIHHGPYFSAARVRRLVDRVNGLDPDVILLGGDYVHRDPKYIQPSIAELAAFDAPFGVFAVLGNHDHWEGAEETRARLREAGITIIENRAQWLSSSEERIRIGGVGDLWEDTQDLRATVDEAGEDDFVILISHNPDYVEKVTSNKVDLVLSGHTHGGQVTLFGLWAPLVPSKYGQKYRSGLVETEYTRVIVSNGVGTITPPVRFWARPDIVLITLERGEPGRTSRVSE
jgi:predicted MPP superfamily phosphohydrolase